jgi:hypothetical protein
VKDYYSILGLPRYASEDEIKEAYRRLALRWHPDLNLDEEARQKMQDLNRAKEVLFEKETRDEYKKLLDTQDALSYENLQRIRKKYKDQRDAESVEIDKLYPVRRKQIIVFTIVLIGGITGLLFLFLKTGSHNNTDEDHVRNIVERHSLPFARDAAKKNIPTPTDSLETLAEIATVSAMMGDLETAAYYWEILLQHGGYRLSTVTDLVLARVKMKDYSGAFGAIETYPKTADDKLVLYVTLGDYFKSERQLFDAEDAYKKALEFMTNVDTTRPAISEAIRRAKEEIRR